MATIPSNSSKNHYDASRFKSYIDDLKRRFPHNPEHPTHHNSTLLVSVENQKLYAFIQSEFYKSYTISTALAGTGNLESSLQTPLGAHFISQKIGEDSLIGSIFKGRKNTLKIADIISDASRSNSDNITSRILWLEGLEEGINKGKDVNNCSIDSYSRYIYIHGTDEEGLLGKPVSHGCIRMANKDIIDLYPLIELGTLVLILEDEI